MADLLVWFLVIECVGLLVFPFTYRVFSRMPDRGWTLAKPLGLLFISYGVWLAGLSHTIPNSRWSVLLAALVVAVLVWAAARKHWSELLAFLRKETPVLVYSELVFVAVFVAWAVFRGYAPAIVHTEQPMDFMFLNSVVTSLHYPPNDPWLAGELVSYYYFGYLMAGVLALASGVPTAVAYNLALATTAAMAALAAFGLVYNLVRLSRGSAFAGALAGLAAAFLLVGASNLAGGLFFLQAMGFGGERFWVWVGIEGLTAPGVASESWIPAGLGWWWWPASRVIPGAITEFPQFSFLLGDMHPHVMSIPFVLLVAGLGLQVYRSPGLLDLAGLRRLWPLVLAVPLAVGALAAINAWDLPLALAVLAGALFLNVTRQTAGPTAMPPRLRWAAWAALALAVLLLPAFSVLRDAGFTARAAIVLEGLLIGVACLLIAGGLALRAVAVALALALAAAALFVPFYMTFETNVGGIFPLHGLQTRPLHLLLVWGVAGALALAFLASIGLRLLRLWGGLRVLRTWGSWGDRLLFSVAVGFAPVLLWLQPVWGLLSYAGFAVAFLLLRLTRPRAVWWPAALQMGAIGLVVLLAYDAIAHVGPEPGGAGAVLSRLLVVVPMATVVALSVYGAWSLARRQPTDSDLHDETAPAIVLGALALAGALVMGAELFYVADVFGGFLRRMNTVFKLYYQAWLLMALVGGYAVYYVGDRWDLRSLFGRVGLATWTMVLVLAFGAVLYYPVASTSSRASGGFTLDGQAYLAAEAPAEHQAIEWIRKNLPRDAVVVEAAVTSCGDSPRGCSDWTSAGRIAGSTGRPTILGWEQHELQWRNSLAPLEGRLDDVRELYQTTDAQRAKVLLAKYDVRYVVVSARERSAYGLEGIPKFATLGTVVFPPATAGLDVVIYQVSP